MSWLDRFRPQPMPTRAAAPQIKAGRPTDALNRDRARSLGFGSLVPREGVRDYRVQERTTVLDTLRIVRDRDPDAAQAITNFLLLMGQGYEVTAYRAGADTVIDDAATAYVRAFDARVGPDYGGGMDVLIDVINLTLVTQGASCVELEIASDLRSVVDVHPIDPARIVFKREAGTNRLMRGVQVARGTAGADSDGFLELSPRQCFYMPLHPDVDRPYGRSPILAALTAIFFKIEILEDLRAVVHNQGYPRLDVAVVEEAVIRNAPAGSTPDQLQLLVNDLLTDIQEQYAALRPDDTFIHPDSIKVGYVGPSGGGAVNFDVLQRVLDTQIIAGLKQLPILLGRNEGSTTTHATVQWRIFALLIDALQRRTKRLLEQVHTTALQLAGYQATARVTFAGQPTTERLVEAQALETEVRAFTQARDNGWIDDDEAANTLFGHGAVAAGAPPAPDAESENENE